MSAEPGQATIRGISALKQKDQTGGAQLWLESQSVQTDAEGDHTAQFGTTEPEGLPLDLLLRERHAGFVCV